MWGIIECEKLAHLIINAWTADEFDCKAAQPVYRGVQGCMGGKGKLYALCDL